MLFARRGDTKGLPGMCKRRNTYDAVVAEIQDVNHILWLHKALEPRNLITFPPDSAAIHNPDDRHQLRRNEDQLRDFQFRITLNIGVSVTLKQDRSHQRFDERIARHVFIRL